MVITSGVAELSIAVDRLALARYGMDVMDIEQAASGGSGDVISEVHAPPDSALTQPSYFFTDSPAMSATSISPSQSAAPAGM